MLSSCQLQTSKATTLTHSALHIHHDASPRSAYHPRRARHQAPYYHFGPAPTSHHHSLPLSPSSPTIYHPSSSHLCGGPSMSIARSLPLQPSAYLCHSPSATIECQSPSSPTHYCGLAPTLPSTSPSRHPEQKGTKLTILGMGRRMVDDGSYKGTSLISWMSCHDYCMRLLSIHVKIYNGTFEHQSLPNDHPKCYRHIMQIIFFQIVMHHHF